MMADRRMDGVSEYCEGDYVHLTTTEVAGTEKLVIKAMNEGGHNWTEVDLLDLIAWLKANRPELLK